MGRPIRTAETSARNHAALRRRRRLRALPCLAEGRRRALPCVGRVPAHPAIARSSHRISIDVLNDENWPEDLRIYRSQLKRSDGVPLWLVVSDHEIVERKSGAAAWREQHPAEDQGTAQAGTRFRLGSNCAGWLRARQPRLEGTARLDAIAGDEPVELRHVAHHDVGGSNLDADRSKFRENPRQRFRLQAEPPGDQRFVVRKRNRARPPGAGRQRSQELGHPLHGALRRSIARSAEPSGADAARSMRSSQSQCQASREYSVSHDPRSITMTLAGVTAEAVAG